MTNKQNDTRSLTERPLDQKFNFRISVIWRFLKTFYLKILNKKKLSDLKKEDPFIY